MDWKLVEAIFIILFVKIPGWFLKHRIFLVVGVVVIGGIWAYRSCVSPAQKPIIAEEKNIPTVKAAPYVLATPSRYYYVVTYKEVSNSEVILFKWYEWDGEKWDYRAYELTITKDLYGDYRLYEREK